MVDFFEFSNEMLCLADERGYFTRVNKAWVKTLGWSIEELTSRPYTDFVHPDDLQATIREASLLLHGNHETVRFENRYRCQDGSYRWFAWQATLGSEPGQLVAAARDVTDQKAQAEALRQSEERFRTLAKRAPIGIVQSDAEGSVFFANDRWCELADVQPEAALGFAWKQLIHPADLEPTIRLWQAGLAAGQDVIMLEFRYLHRDGGIRWASSTVASQTDAAGQVVGQIAALQDITERKAAHDALLAEQELLRKSIEFLERERKLIAYDIHDGFMQYAVGAFMHLQGYQAELQDPAEIARIEPAIMALRKTIEEGRRVMNGVKTYVLDQFGVVAAIEELVRERATPKTELEFVPPAKALGRLTPEWETALYRITQEAVTNALKHSRSPKVRIALEHDDELIRLEVRDWGVGTEIKTASRGVHGLPGIKERIALLKGRFDLKSSPGGGTRIKIELPMRRPNGEA